MKNNGAIKNKKLYTVGMIAAFLALTAAAVGFSIFYRAFKNVSADVTAPKILIISNDDTYVPSGVTGGTSASAMQTYLAAQGFSVTVLSETSNPNTVTASYAATADTYDLVIFTQGVGHRSTTNNKQGLNANDLAFLKEYLNITNISGGPHKAKLIIEGEDVWYDIGLVGTSTDALNVLKINTSSSRADEGTITQLYVVDSSHKVNEGLALSAPTSYQTSWQDALVATTGAHITDNGDYGSGIFGAINTFDDGAGHRRVFMPFAWDANSSNLITDKTWRERLLLNEVKWVGERKVTVAGSNLASPQVAYGALEAMLDVTLTAAWGDTATAGAVGKSGISGMKVTVTGSAYSNPAATISSVLIYDDLNNNGIIDGGEPVLGSSSSFTGNTCIVNFTTPFPLAAGSVKNLIVAYQLTGVTSGTVGASLADNTALLLSPSDYLAKTYGIETAINSVISTIAASGTAEILSPANNATIGGFTNITGTSSGEYYLEYSPGFNSSGPWTQITHNTSAVNRASLGNWNTTGLTDGGYTLRLRLVSGAVVTINVTTDNTAPVISAVSAATRPTSATISWTTDESSTSNVVYKLASDSVWTTVYNSALVLSHSVLLSGLVSNSNYQYYVQSADAAGNMQTSPTYTFTTPQMGAYAEITSPAIIAQVIPRVGGTVNITGTAKTDRSGGTVAWTVYYGQGTDITRISNWIALRSSTSPVINDIVYGWNTNIIQNSSYGIKLVAADTGITGPTAVMEYSVPVIVDNTPPIIDNVRVVRVSNISADLAWDTNKTTTDVVQYGTTSGIYPNSVTVSNGDRKVFLSGLTANTIYYFKVTATDGAGHSVSSAEYSFTTTNITDSTVPSVVYTNLRATGRTDTTVDLTWSPGSDNTGISAYRIWRSLDGISFVNAGTVSGTAFTFTDTGLSASTSYYYRLTALDLAGNESAPSNTVQVPTVGSFRINPHGTYPKLTGMCVKCHHTHRGQKSMLFNNTQEQKVCFSCHNGTGSQYDVQSEYDPTVGWTSRHPMPMMNTGKECASCHNPHLSSTSVPKLLSAKKANGTIVSSGPQFCLVCHGDEVVNKMIYDIGGSHQPYIGSVHDTQMVPPLSGTGVTCSNCHRNHSSMEVRLTKAKEELNCFQCHSSTGADASQYSGRSAAYKTVLFSVYDDFQKVSHHKISDSDQADGSKIECVNCHNPHYITDDQAGNKKIISDPNNTNKTWLTTDPLMGRTSNFCIRCHDTNTNDPTKLPMQQVDDKTVVAYTVKFPSVPAQTNFTSNGGGWDKSGYTSSQHYAMSIECINCHDPHGTNNVRLAVYGEDPNSTPTSTSGICLRCHGGVAGATPAGPDVYTNGFAATGSFPTKHPSLTTSGVHSDTETISGMARHADCYDCHDPHAAKSGASEQNPILGATGVNITNWNGANYSNWGTTTPTWSLAPITSSDYQYELCFKCHSKFTYASPPNNPSTNNGTVFTQTDIAKDFAPTNYAKHIIVPGSVTGMDPTRGNFIGSKYNFSSTGTSTVLKCTYCHGASTGTVRGPHGSGNKFMLVAPWYPYQSTLPAGRTTYTGSGTNDKNDLCFLCHSYAFYVSNNAADGSLAGTSGLDSKPHTDTAHRQAYGCSACHGGLPHGWLRGNTAGNHGVPLSIQSDPAPYNFGAGLTDVQLREPGTWNGGLNHNGCTVAWPCT